MMWRGSEMGVNLLGQMVRHITLEAKTIKDKLEQKEILSLKSLLSSAHFQALPYW